MGILFLHFEVSLQQRGIKAKEWQLVVVVLKDMKEVVLILF